MARANRRRHDPESFFRKVLGEEKTLMKLLRSLCVMAAFLAVTSTSQLFGQTLPPRPAVRVIELPSFDSSNWPADCSAIAK
jgi:hypothetical protein